MVSQKPVSFQDDTTPQSVAVKIAAEKFHLNRTKKEFGLSGHDLGCHDLNMAIGGARKGDLTVIAARSGIGKSSFLTPMIRASKRVIQGRRTAWLYLSWEARPELFVNKLVCEEVGIIAMMLDVGAKLMTPEQCAQVHDAYRRARDIKVRYQIASTNISTIRKYWKSHLEDCKRASDVEEVEIIPCLAEDYIQMASFDGGNKNYGISEHINGLKEMAMKDNGCIKVLAQLNRGEADKNPPQRGDLKDSADIEMACDNLVLLHRPEYNGIPEIEEGVSSENKMMLRTVKSRYCGPSDKIINCEIKYNRFWNQDHLWGYEYWNDYAKEEFWYKHFGLTPKSEVMFPELQRMAA